MGRAAIKSTVVGLATRVDNKTELQLARSEEKYRGLLEAAPDAMVVVDAAGEIVLLNVQAENQFGYSRDELIGHKVTDIIPTGFAERLIADGSRSPAEALAQQIGTGIVEGLIAGNQQSRFDRVQRDPEQLVRRAARRRLDAEQPVEIPRPLLKLARLGVEQKQQAVRLD